MSLYLIKMYSLCLQQCSRVSRTNVCDRSSCPTVCHCFNTQLVIFFLMMHQMVVRIVLAYSQPYRINSSTHCMASIHWNNTLHTVKIVHVFEMMVIFFSRRALQIFTLSIRKTHTHFISITSQWRIELDVSLIFEMPYHCIDQYTQNN